MVDNPGSINVKRSFLFEMVILIIIYYFDEESNLLSFMTFFYYYYIYDCVDDISYVNLLDSN